MGKQTRYRAASVTAIAVIAVLLAACGGGSSSGGGASNAQGGGTVVTVDTLPILNGTPLKLAIDKGFFKRQGITIKTKLFQTGNDIVLSLVNHSGDVGFIGYVPAMVADSHGIPVRVVSASDDGGATQATDWQTILVKKNSPIRTVTDLEGKTIAVNALKNVGEVVVRSSLKKLGVPPYSVKLVAVPFPQERAALNNGQVDAIWAAEPFLTQALTLDGDRQVMAPSAVLGKYWPNGCYAAIQSWISGHASVAARFRTAMNEALQYAASHPQEIRAHYLPPGQKNVRMPVWSPKVNRTELAQLASYSKEFGAIPSIPNLSELVPASIPSGTPSGS